MENLKEMERTKQLKECLKSEGTMDAAAKKMGIDRTYAYLIRKKSIENHTWLTSEELKQVEERKKQRKQASRNAKIAELKENVKQSYTYEQIAEIMGYSKPYLEKLRKQAIDDHIWLTEEELKEIEEKKKQRKEAIREQTRKKAKGEKQQEKERIKQEEIAELKKYIREIYTYKEIAEMMNYSVSYLQKLRKQAIADQIWFSAEELREIEEKRRQRRKEIAKKARKQKMEGREREKQNQIVESKKQVIAHDTCSTLEELDKIENLEKLEKTEEIQGSVVLEESGERKQRQQEKREKKKKERKQKQQEERERKKRDQIIELKKNVKKLYTYEEISLIMGYSVSRLYELKKQAKLLGIWLTPEELEEIKKAKEKRRQEKREKEKKQRRQKQQEERERKKRDLIIELKKNIKKLYTYKEIVPIMGYSVSRLHEIKKQAKLLGIWFTPEELEEIEKEKEQRRQEKREKEENERRQKQQERKRKKQEKIYARHRKLAQKEQDLELEGEEEGNIEKRENFIATLNETYPLKGNLSDQDTELVLTIMHMHPELGNKESIRILIAEANKREGLKSAQKVIHEMIEALQDTEFHKPLVEYREWINRKILYSKIKAMKEQKMDHTAIGRKLGITSAEVSIIFHHTTPPDFFDFEGR